MAAPRWQNVAATELEAPDITRAGSLFSSALAKIGGAATRYQQGVQDVAVDDFKNEVRGSDTLNQLGNISYDRLNNTNIGADELAQLEASLREKQFDVYGNDLSRGFDQQLGSNLTNLESALSSNKGFADTISIDRGGNPIFYADQNNKTQQEEYNKTEYIRALQGTNFQAIGSEQDQNKAASKTLRSFGATKEQEAAFLAQNNAYQQSKQTLSAAQQKTVANNDAAIDFNTKQRQNQLDVKYTQLEGVYGYNEQEALAKIKTKATDVHAYIDANLGKELWFWEAMQQKGGIDVKEYTASLFANNRGLKPWMVLDALKEVTDRDKGAENVDISDFDDAMERNLKDTDLLDNLNNASRLGADKNLEALGLQASSSNQKAQSLRQFKGEQGFRDTQRNTAIFRTKLQEAVAAGEITQADAEALLLERETATAESELFSATKNGERVSTVEAEVVKINPLGSKFLASVMDEKGHIPDSSLKDMTLETAINDVDRGYAQELTPEQLTKLKSINPLALQAILQKRDTSIAYTNNTQQAVSDGAKSVQAYGLDYLDRAANMFNFSKPEPRESINPLAQFQNLTSAEGQFGGRPGLTPTPSVDLEDQLRSQLSPTPAATNATPAATNENADKELISAEETKDIDAQIAQQQKAKMVAELEAAQIKNSKSINSKSFKDLVERLSEMKLNLTDEAWLEISDLEVEIGMLNDSNPSGSTTSLSKKIEEQIYKKRIKIIQLLNLSAEDEIALVGQYESVIDSNQKRRA